MADETWNAAANAMFQSRSAFVRARKGTAILAELRLAQSYCRVAEGHLEQLCIDAERANTADPGADEAVEAVE